MRIRIEILLFLIFVGFCLYKGCSVVVDEFDETRSTNPLTDVRVV